ncbi:MAG: DNA mismatch repair endonuclease MutL [Hyphomicrobiales bacterium]
MSKIRILPDILSNKIAAGEVVERPASVVKELAENALDAGATRILVDIEQGGRSLIRVADNGGGMNRDDALLAIERHATSKIFSDPDLFNIRTLGFRGEALPSIAAVSRFSLVTRDAASEAGTELTLEGGKLVNVAETGAPEGTLVTVRQLFFNTPARRKFLKSISTEMAHIADILASMALAWPRVQFRLTHNEKVVKNWPAAAEPFDRALEVLGGGLRQDLHGIALSREELSVSGWISSPRIHRKSSNAIFILVNRRFVRDRVAQHALFQGYSQRLVKGQFPLAVLFLSVPHDQVDVNVHPAKSEVRFARPNDVHELIRRAVAQTLYEVDRPTWKPVGYQQETPKTSKVKDEEEGFGDRRLAGEAPRLDDRSETPLPRHTGESGTPYPASRIQDRVSSIADRESNQRLQTEIWEKRGFAGVRVIGQLHDTYILCEAEDGLILVDQHAAHERVLYEQLTSRAESGGRASQALLVPETVDLGFREAQAVEAFMPQMRELGFDVEPFGGGTVVVKAVPTLLAGRELRPLLVEIAEAAAGSRTPSKPQEALDFCRQRAACHGAIRAGQALTFQQMQDLLRQLDACVNLSHCPHGRPTWLKWEMGVIERSFRRT